MKDYNGYELSRAWFDFCFENPELINPAHTAIYLFAIEHCNRLGWKRKFGFPSQMTMDALGIKKHQTYIKYFNDLVEWGAFSLIQKSRNQYSANIISICAMTENSKALDKAFIFHAAKQTQSNRQSNSSVSKPLTKEEPLTNKQVFSFKKSFLDLGVEENILSDWLKVRKTKKATNSETAFLGIFKQIKESGLTANECIKISAENSWSGFNNGWTKNKFNGKTKQNNNRGFESDTTNGAIQATINQLAKKG